MHRELLFETGREALAEQGRCDGRRLLVESGLRGQFEGVAHSLGSLGSPGSPALREETEGESCLLLSAGGR